MYAILGEDRSDTDTLKVIVHRLLANPSLKVYVKGYSGSGELKRKGAKQIKLYAKQGVSRFIICRDSDTRPQEEVLSEMHEAIVVPSGVAHPCCKVVPVQELEAWILADLEKVQHVIPSWRPLPKPISQPETIQHPKEHLIRLSHGANHKPRYRPVTFNPQMAKFLDLATVYTKCPSFRALKDFVL